MSVQTSPLQQQTASVDDLRKIASSGQVYAILDACDAPPVPEKVKELSDDRAASLYRGSAEEDYWAVAPYLVRVDGALLDWITATLWSEPWGIFAVTQVDLETLRKHFRHFLVVELPDGKQAYFRYYDPRILTAFLPTCSSEELKEFFGPIRAYAVADRKDGGITLWKK